LKTKEGNKSRLHRWQNAHRDTDMACDAPRAGKAGQAGFPITMQPRCHQQQIFPGPEFLNPNITTKKA
jgi:hypothetical protein